jgi:hypothetical protein
MSCSTPAERPTSALDATPIDRPPTSSRIAVMSPSASVLVPSVSP